MFIYVLCGLPASGKSTLRAKLEEAFGESGVIICSTDDYIDRYAVARGQTYNDVFKQAIGLAHEVMWREFDHAIANDLPIIFDQTNLTAYKRKMILRKVPEHYYKIAINVVPPADDVWQERLANRPEKIIPENIIAGMKRDFEAPTEAEGFNTVITWYSE